MKVFIIGNGFDKGHDLKTNYWDFRIYLKNMYPEFLNAFEGHYYIYPANNEKAQRELLWNELEKNLANIDEDVIIDNALQMDMALESGDVGIEDTLYEYFTDQYKYIDLLAKYLKQWVRTIRIRDVKPRTSLINKVEDAIYISDIAQKVYLIHRRDSFKAEEILINELKTKENIEIILNSTITKLNGENKLESVDITNNNKETKTIEVEALFIAIGQVPETENFKKLININEQGYVIANEDCKTNIKNIFVAGDNRTKGLRQLVTATSDGAVAATQAIKYINSK